nr:hypothetical protein [Pandoravirus belohorizontensis]
MTTRPILMRTTSHMICEGLVTVAARAGSMASVAYMHDRMFDADSLCACPCTGAVGRAAWAAPTPDVIQWMRLHGCAGGCESANNQDLALAVVSGRTAMARYILAEAFLAIDRSILSDAMGTAASKGHIDTLRVVLDTDASVGAAPVVVGAARGGRIDVLSWICNDKEDHDDRQRCRGDGRDDDDGDDNDDGDDHVNQHADTSRSGQTMSVMRAAAVAAVMGGQLATLAWIIDRYARVVDVTLLRAAVVGGSVGAVRMIDALFPAPFDWRRFVVCAIGSGSVDVVRFIVEEKGAAIDPFSMADADLVSDEMAVYVSTVCTPGEMQVAFDATLVDGNLCPGKRANQMISRIPRLCVGLASATEIGEVCATCLSGQGPCLEMAYATRPAKRRRTARRQPVGVPSAPASPPS